MCQLKFEINGRNVALGFPSLLQIAISVVAIYYGVTNQKEMCSDSFIHLAIWMIVQGAVMLFVSVGWCPSLLCGPPGMFVYGIVAGLYSLFNIAWSVVGGVILWRDSKSCEDLDPAFYYASFAVVVASLVLAACTLCCSYQKRSGSDSQA